jgi:peptidoglycan-associated lipoprotein
VSPSQINTISYGEERAAAFGQDEASWAENRRGVLAY